MLPYRADETLDNNQRLPHIDFWNPTPEETYCIPDGKSMVVFFHKIFPSMGCNTTLNTFVVDRDSYASRLDSFRSKDGTVDKGICHYINYFINFYDEDKELLMAYLKLKYVLDSKNIRPMKSKVFRKYLIDILYTDTMIEKLHRLTDANYIVDLDQDPEDTNKYHESLQFTNEHAKIMMSISYMMKIACPVIYHYFQKLEDRAKDVPIYKFYRPLFQLMTKDGINILNKIVITALAKYNANRSHNRAMWDKIEILGRGRDTAIKSLVEDKLISDNIFKYTYRKNIVNFNSVILEKQLGYYNRENHGVDLKEVNSDKVAGTGLSGKDKYEMASNKVDESLIIISKLNAKRVMKKIQERYNVHIPKEELDYYMTHMRIDQSQADLVNYIFAKDFKGFTDMDLLRRKQYVKLFIILRRLLEDAGNEYLQEIITGNRANKLNSRSVQNTKFINDVKATMVWQALVKEKYAYLKYIGKEDMVLNIISGFLNTTYTYCDYDHPERFGEIIDYDKLELQKEILRLLLFI